MSRPWAVVVSGQASRSDLKPAPFSAWHEQIEEIPHRSGQAIKHEHTQRQPYRGSTFAPNLCTAKEAAAQASAECA
jgi:hypothetical protein